MPIRAEMQGPHGKIHCMDVRCECGYLSHIEINSTSYFKCKCGKLWEISPYVKLVSMKESDLNNSEVITEQIEG